MLVFYFGLDSHFIEFPFYREGTVGGRTGAGVTFGGEKKSEEEKTKIL